MRQAARHAASGSRRRTAGEYARPELAGRWWQMRRADRPGWYITGNDNRKSNSQESSYQRSIQGQRALAQFQVAKSETLTQVEIIRLLVARLARKNEPVPPPPSGHKQFPMALRDNFDVAVDHFEGGLIVNSVGRHW